MTCAGCSFGVRESLLNLGLNENQIVEVDHKTPDPKNQIGHATIRFAKSEYNGLVTDCALIKAVKASPGYTMYLDKANQDPCSLKKK